MFSPHSGVWLLFKELPLVFPMVHRSSHRGLAALWAFCSAPDPVIFIVVKGNEFGWEKRVWRGGNWVGKGTELCQGALELCVNICTVGCPLHSLSTGVH